MREGRPPESIMCYMLSGLRHSFGPHEELHSSSVWFLLLQVAKKKKQINRKLPPSAVPLNAHIQTRIHF